MKTKKTNHFFLILLSIFGSIGMLRAQNNITYNINDENGADKYYESRCNSGDIEIIVSFKSSSLICQGGITLKLYEINLDGSESQVGVELFNCFVCSDTKTAKFYVSAVSGKYRAEASRVCNTFPQITSGGIIHIDAPYNLPPSYGFNSDLIKYRTVSGDFDGDGKINDIAGLYDQGGSSTDLFVWSSTGSNLTFTKALDISGYPASHFSGRFVSGDFDNDGKFDDIVGFYDNGGSSTLIVLWTSENGVFNQPVVRRNQTGIPASKLTGRMVSGDFDHDGYHNDIAGFYDNGGSSTRVFVWEFGTSSVSSAKDYKTISGYPSSRITGRVVSGDFDHDGYHDDIATFYDNGSSTSKIHMWTGKKNTSNNVNYFSYSNQQWWYSSGFPASRVSYRIVSGDFDHDGYHDDISAVYDNGGNSSRIFTWLSNTSSFSINSGLGWISNGFPSSSLTGRLVSGDFDNNGKVGDLIGMYRDNVSQTRTAVWKNNGTSITLQDMLSWWSSAWCVFQVNGSNGSNGQNGQLIDQDSSEEKEYDKESIMVYPNPFDNEIVIKSDDDIDFSVSIVDCLGKQVRNTETQGNTKIDLSELTSGVYYVRIFKEGNVTIKKIIKK